MSEPATQGVPPTVPGATADSDLRFRDHITIAAPAREVWGMVADVTRHGEWSPVCTGCSWDEGTAGAGGVPAVGDRFTGTNTADGRTWETRSVIVASEPGARIAWQVNEDWVRWGFLTEPADAADPSDPGDAAGPGAGSTVLTETWEFLPAGLAGFRAREGGEEAIALRARQARAGIPETLAAIRAIAEAGRRAP